MKNNRHYFLFALVFPLVLSCTRPQVRLQKEISIKEKQLLADSSLVPDRKKANEVIKLYIEYADKFQDDTAAGTFLFKAGDLAFKIRQHEDAITYFGRVQRYPANSQVAIALFLQGFIAETELNDKARARKFYEDFIKKYPQHYLADDVQVTLSNLDKSDEQLIREFEEKLKEQQQASGK